MDEMAGIILEGKTTHYSCGRRRRGKRLKIIDAIYLAAKTGKKVEVKI
jgi:hypothetical protein